MGTSGHNVPLLNAIKIPQEGFSFSSALLISGQKELCEILLKILSSHKRITTRHCFTDLHWICNLTRYNTVCYCIPQANLALFCLHSNLCRQSFGICFATASKQQSFFKFRCHFCLFLPKQESSDGEAGWQVICNQVHQRDYSLLPPVFVVNKERGLLTGNQYSFHGGATPIIELILMYSVQLCASRIVVCMCQ